MVACSKSLFAIVAGKSVNKYSCDKGDLPTRTSVLDNAERSKIASVLSQVFYSDPHFSWLLKGIEDSRQGLIDFFDCILQELSNTGGVLSLTDDGYGVMIWYPPGRWPISLINKLKFFRRYISIVGIRRAIFCGLQLLRMERKHPRCPHAYLQTIGVSKAEQGRGLGSKLITELIQHCENVSVPIYLETSVYSNINFYGRYGFLVTNQTTLAGNLTLWSMFRPGNSGIRS